MDSPFIFDKSVTGKHFVGRKQDTQSLCNLLRQGEHVALYDTPRSGKSSLIQQALFQLRTSGFSFTVGQMSLLGIRSRDEFLARLGEAAIRCFASSPGEYEAIVRELLADTHWVFDREAFAREDRILSRGWDIGDADMDAVIALPFRLASRFGQNLILILDHFSNIDLIEGGSYPLIKRLETWLRERGTGCSFLFTGSAFNAMREIFDERKDFYRIVERFRMQPIDPREFADHTLKGFLSGGKVIDRDLISGVYTLFKGHPGYINHFLSICNAMAKGYVTEPVLMDALSCLLAIHEPRFIATMNGLTTHQVHFLRAVIDGHKKFSTAEVISRYGLNSSANVKRVREALIKKEVISFDDNDNPLILDPLFEYWVRQYFFEINA